VGVIQGFKDKPVKDVTFENCQVEAKRGLTLSNADVNTTGLTITGVQGEPVIHAGAAGQPQ
jgi:hypothetical protein